MAAGNLVSGAAQQSRPCGWLLASLLLAVAVNKRVHHFLVNNKKPARLSGRVVLAYWLTTSEKPGLHVWLGLLGFLGECCKHANFSVGLAEYLQ